jgi:hypothetical protein
MAAMTLAALKTEIDTDPKALGYAALWAQSNGPEAVAARLNEPNTVPADTIFKSYVSLEDMLAEIVFSEYSGWSAAQKTNIDQFLRGTRIKTGSANMRTTLAALIPVGASRTAMIAIAARPASRAEVLWGEFARVTDTNVAEAKAL